jgi:hypothetical protein
VDHILIIRTTNSCVIKYTDDNRRFDGFRVESGHLTCFVPIIYILPSIRVCSTNDTQKFGRKLILSTIYSHSIGGVDQIHLIDSRDPQ